MGLEVATLGAAMMDDKVVEGKKVKDSKVVGEEAQRTAVDNLLLVGMRVAAEGSEGMFGCRSVAQGMEREAGRKVLVAVAAAAAGMVHHYLGSYQHELSLSVKAKCRSESYQILADSSKHQKESMCRYRTCMTASPRR